MYVRVSVNKQLIWIHLVSIDLFRLESGKCKSDGVFPSFSSIHSPAAGPPTQLSSRNVYFKFHDCQVIAS